MQLNPLATVQTVDYRSPTPSTAMRLLVALNRTRAQRQPLPSPLPDEPEVPFEYLIRLYTTIGGPDYLSPPDQAALVAQLQFGLREDGDHEAARSDIVMLLSKLRDREDVTYRTRSDVEAILASIDAEPPPQPPTATDTTAKAEGQLGTFTAPVSTGPPPPPPAPEPVWQQPADLHVAATQQRPTGWTPVPPPRLADRPLPDTRTPPRQPWWRRKVNRRTAIAVLRWPMRNTPTPSGTIEVGYQIQCVGGGLLAAMKPSIVNVKVLKEDFKEADPSAGGHGVPCTGRLRW
jgi:hypothetical protein